MNVIFIGVGTNICTDFKAVYSDNENININIFSF